MDKEKNNIKTIEKDYYSFFELDHGRATKYYWFTTIKDENHIKRPIQEYMKSGKAIFDIEKGTTPGDLVGSTWAITFFSEKFVNLLKEKGAKFNTYKLKFETKIPCDYYYVEPLKYVHDITGISGKGKINIKMYRDGSVATHGQEGLYFDLKEWEGEDFFGVKNTLIIIITKKLKEIIEKAKLKNVKFTNVIDYKW